jgi:hypothetical protein
LIETIFELFRQNEDPKEVHAVEKILKDIIDVRYIFVYLQKNLDANSMGSQTMWRRNFWSSMIRATLSR